MELQGSRTEANLMAAFAGESQARNKYTFYAQTARKEGYEQIADIFEMTASNEMAHAKLWIQYLKNGAMPNTLDSLLDAAGGEHYEWSEMYKKFSEVAHQEGFTQIAATMQLVANIEKEHEERFRKLIENVEGYTVFKKDSEVIWICRNCGHVYVGKEAPGVCPACRYPQPFFEVKAENY